MVTVGKQQVFIVSQGIESPGPTANLLAHNYFGRLNWMLGGFSYGK